MTTEQPSEFAYALADFSLSLYRQIAAENQESNILVSPFSISLALTMTYAGADGDTKTQMKQVMFGDWSPVDDVVHSSYADAMEKLNENRNDFKLHSANRIYARRDNVGELLPEFANLLKEKYKSELQAVNFGDCEKTRQLINDWVAEKTDHKIENLISSGALSVWTRLVLINAVYFKGDWKTKFDSKDTCKKQFFPSPNVTKELDTMNMKDRRDLYLEEPEYQLLGIPYGNGDLVMFILLPKVRYALLAVEKQLTGRKLLDALEKAKPTKIDKVSIPKFKLDKTVMMAGILQKLGATDMFSEEKIDCSTIKADLSKINGKRNLFVSEVIHKVFIEINESGTEAAAATATVTRIFISKVLVNKPRPPPIEFIAEHPFLFLIVDKRTNSILFLGRFTG